ncbi:LPXTG cell wall anchor domain-containing protein [Streptomyces sp. P38-E01]|uniref:LPXTG cell wall anchor domain-containing protein n=2 Tax=Streptomyces tardus TaxID=2780544 RepID=A0A949N5S0_9ACTN|nr:LPXTG cell wall anchor domain-containing protein [Streptomyces tardus]
MERYRGLCERAVDPLEIAVGLETDGLTDRSAARFRHRDVFSLAEELYARSPAPADESRHEHPPTRTQAASGPGRRARSWWQALGLLLPGALCTVTALALPLPQTGSSAPGVIAALGVTAVLLSLAYALRRAALSALAATAGTVLLCYALYGDALLGAALAGGPDTFPETASRCVPVTLAWAVAAALGCARWFALRARWRLAESESLSAFAASVRPLLALAVLGFAAAVGLLWQLTHGLLGHRPAGAEWLAVTALGLLLFVALLLCAHGFGRVAGQVLATAAALELLAPMLVFAARLPGLDPLGKPVELLTTAYGEAAVPALVCLVVATGALICAGRLLTGASAHRRPWPG